MVTIRPVLYRNVMYTTNSTQIHPPLSLWLVQCWYCTLSAMSRQVWFTAVNGSIRSPCRIREGMHLPGWLVQRDVFYWKKYLKKQKERGWNVDMIWFLFFIFEQMFWIFDISDIYKLRIIFWTIWFYNIYLKMTISTKKICNEHNKQRRLIEYKFKTFTVCWKQDV